MANLIMANQISIKWNDDILLYEVLIQSCLQLQIYKKPALPVKTAEGSLENNKINLNTGHFILVWPRPLDGSSSCHDRV